MASNRRSWQLDWAGPHGTAWGTINACLTTISVGWVGHLVHVHWPLSTTVVAVIAAAGTAVGAVWVLGHAALGGNAADPVTVAYKLACLAGINVWLVYMEMHASWPGRWLVVRLVILAAAAGLAGMAAGLASDRPIQTESPASDRDPAPTDPAEAALRARAAQWAARIDRYCDIQGTEIRNIEDWPRGNGYSIEAVIPAGGLDWRAIEVHAGEIGADLDLVRGGRIAVEPGQTRRIAIIDVTTLDILAQETEYPADREVHSISDDLAIGHRDTGELVGPNLVQFCMNLSGEARSGKTNASHCLTAEIVTTNDCLQWDWELTGGGLWAPWMYGWLHNAYETPPIDWCAFDARELLWMTRAALRIGYARKPGYRDLMIRADDDKLPVSPQIPGIIIVGDEIAKVTGTSSEHEEARENLRLVVFELGAVAVRAIFLGLRGTDDVISQSVQSQCHVRGVMRINSKAEAGWTLGSGHDFGPQDTPYPGCGGLVLGSGEQVIRMKWFRMKPSQIMPIARLASTRRPKLDELSRLAANGRHPDGTPMGVLYEGELDCYETRWERFRAHAGGMPSGGSVRSGGIGVVTTPDLEKAQSDVEAALAAVDRRVAEKAHADVGLSDDERATFDEIASGLSDLAAPVAPEHRQVMLDRIADAGPRGMRPKDLLAQLAAAEIVISRASLHNYLNEAKAAGLVYQPSFGRWAVC